MVHFFAATDTRSAHSGAPDTTRSQMRANSAATTAYSECAEDSGGTPLVLTVRQAWSAIGVPTSSGSTTFGQPLTFTAIVSALAPGSGTPNGIVTFKDGPTVLGIA